MTGSTEQQERTVVDDRTDTSLLCRQAHLVLGLRVGVVDGSEGHTDRIAGSRAIRGDAPQSRHAVLEQGRRDETVGSALDVHREVDGAGAALQPTDLAGGRAGRQLVDVAAGCRGVGRWQRVSVPD